MINSIESKREFAKKQVEEIKGFYIHLMIFVLVNGLFYAIKLGWLQSLLPDWFPQEVFYHDWMNTNLVVWGFILAIHGLTLYRHRFNVLKNWEERQIIKYMEEDNFKSKKYK